MSYFETIYADTELPSRARRRSICTWGSPDAEGKCYWALRPLPRHEVSSLPTVKRASRSERHDI